MQGLIMKPDPQNWIECYIDAYFSGVLNQYKGLYPVFVLSRTGCIIMFTKCLIIWASRLQTEINLSTTEGGYIAPSQSIRDILNFMVLIKDIELGLEIQFDIPEVLGSIFENKTQFTNKIKGQL